jgi:hypothetical protein
MLGEDRGKVTRIRNRSVDCYGTLTVSLTNHLALINYQDFGPAQQGWLQGHRRLVVQLRRGTVPLNHEAEIGRFPGRDLRLPPLAAC